MSIITGCVKNNEDPSWLTIEPWTLIANPDLLHKEGELSHNFTDAWVYADGKLVGVFQLPIKIPLLKTGTSKIRILPTIRNNGISSTKIPYPMVEPYEVEVQLEKNGNTTINPVTKYASNTKFWIEDFEDPGLKFEHGPSSTAKLTVKNDPQVAKYGKYGCVNLNSDSSLFTIYNTDQNNLVLPKQNNYVFLEVDYRSTNSLVSGIIEVSSVTVKNHSAIQMNSQDSETVHWKKIYIDLKELVTNTQDAEYYKISLSAILDVEGTNREIVIDNIKVLHF